MEPSFDGSVVSLVIQEGAHGMTVVIATTWRTSRSATGCSTRWTRNA